MTNVTRTAEAAAERKAAWYAAHEREVAVTAALQEADRRIATAEIELAAAHAEGLELTRTGGLRSRTRFGKRPCT